MTDRLTTARIEADPDVPIIRITRDFEATPAQLFRAHTDPDLYARWVGPDDLSTRVEHWDARRGGSWRFVNIREAEGENWVWGGAAFLRAESPDGARYDSRVCGFSQRGNTPNG